MAVLVSREAAHPADGEPPAEAALQRFPGHAEHLDDIADRPVPVTMALRRHWPEYLIEAMGLAVFMLSAAVFATLLEHPTSPLHQALVDPLLRRLLMGLAMGSTAIAIVY